MQFKTTKFIFILTSIILITSVSVFAGKAGNFFNSVGNIRYMASVLGISFFGLVGMLLSFKKVIKEFTDVIILIQSIVHKYSSIPEIHALKKEVIEALESLSYSLKKTILFRKLGKRIDNLTLRLKS